MSSGTVNQYQGQQKEAREFGSLPPRNAQYVKKAFRDSPADETLMMKAARVISSNFQRNPQDMDLIPKRCREKVLELLPTNLDIKISSKRVHSEKYWKRCCEERWKGNCVKSLHGNTWKQTYFERYLQDLLETFDPKRGDDDGALRENVKASKDFVFSLKITQLLAHPDLSLIFDNLQNLSDLTLTYGVKRLRMRYDRALFGMKLSDAESLSRCLKTSQMLCRLSLPSNLIDDDLLEILISGLSANDTITHLDLSNNKIGDLGVQILTEILGRSSTLVSLNLANNQIRAEGGRILGHILAQSCPLTSLNLRLNRIADVGASALFKSLSLNETLTELNVAANCVGYEAALVLSNSLQFKDSRLRHLDLSSNDFTDEDLTMIQSSVKQNKSLMSLDVRLNDTSKGSTISAEIDRHLRDNYDVK